MCIYIHKIRVFRFVNHIVTKKHIKCKWLLVIWIDFGMIKKFLKLNIVPFPISISKVLSANT